LTKGLPLTVGDWMALKRQGLSPDKVDSQDIEQSIKIVSYVLKKCNPDLKDEDIQTLTPTQFGKLTTRIFEMNVDMEENIDIPFYEISTPSPGITDGPSETLKN